MSSKADEKTLGDLLQEVIQRLVDYPDQVQVSTSGEETGTTMFVVKAHPDDRGKVIGREGRTVSALRTLFATMAAVHGKRVMIEVADQRKVEQGRRGEGTKGA